jgi:pimeloyl-ACP methyl ester carboxylesterase
MTYVLVHGSFMGAWCWDYVADRLRLRGHKAYTPTLTGLGSLSHLLTPAVDLNTHVSDIVKLIQSEQLTDIVLVGHSYSGMVVAGVADCMARRLAALVYVDALVPANGQSYFDLADPGLVKFLAEAAESHAESWKIPVVLKAEMASVTGEEAKRIDSLTVPHPRRTMEEPISLGHSTISIPTTYIACTNPWLGESYVRQAEQARRFGWTVREIPTGHLPMITTPDALCNLLVQAGSESA